MNGLGAQLARSYELHPQFRFDRAPLQLDPRRPQAFTTPYEVVRAFQNRLQAREFRACRDDCRRALQDVFAELRAQAEGEEARFLQELAAECTRLLLEELATFHARRPERRAAFVDPGTRAQALSLRRDRFYFGAIAPEVAQQILELGAEDLAIFRSRAQRGHVTREELSCNTGPTVRGIKSVLNREFRRLGVLDAVSADTGRRMAVTALALELSVPQATWWGSSFGELPRPPRTLYAHLDEGIANPKAIVYLSEVDARNGQTSCYPGAYEALALAPLQEIVGRVLANVGSRDGSPLREYYGKQYHQSMTSERFRRHFMRLPPSLRFNSHFGWDVLPDSELETALLQRERFLTGPAGTFIVFDGARLLHRGGMVEQGERVALQVIFSDATVAGELVGRLRRVFA